MTTGRRPITMMYLQMYNRDVACCDVIKHARLSIFEVELRHQTKSDIDNNSILARIFT